jgi:hypothetical protein
MPKKSATEKKKAVAEKVEKKVKEKTKVVVKRVIVDTTAMIESIATKLAEFDKESQKEFLIKLRSDIDKLLTKFAFGGEVQSYNITQSNLSSSSVNMFAGGGLIEMFSDNDEDYVNEELDSIMSSYDVDEETIEEIIRDRSISDVDDLKTYFEDAYFGYANTNTELADRYVEMLGNISELGQNTLETYFDYDAFGRDLAYDYVEYNGHYFNNSYKKGGAVHNRSWHQDHNRHNKSENYEVPISKRKKMAQGGLTEHALEIGDTIVYNARPSNVIKVKAQNGKEYWVNLNLGKRMLTTEHTMANAEKNKDFFRMEKGGSTSFKGRGANIDMAMSKRRGM